MKNPLHRGKEFYETTIAKTSITDPTRIHYAQ